MQVTPDIHALAQQGQLKRAQEKQRNNLLGQSSNQSKLPVSRQVDKNGNITYVYRLHQSKIGKLGNFTYKKQSARAQRLQATSHRVKNKLCKVQNDMSLSQEEKDKKVRNLKGQLKYLKNQLNAEYANAPRISIVIEATE